MSRFIRMPLSGSPNGAKIHISTAEVTIHKSLKDDRVYDELWIYAHNTKDHPITLIIEQNHGAALNVLVDPVDGFIPIFVGALTNNGTRLTCRASEDGVLIAGYGNRVINDQHPIQTNSNPVKRFLNWIWERILSCR